MIHSILPPEAYLQSEPPKLCCMRCTHGFVFGSRDEEGHFILSRLISTDPSAYLDPRFCPGARISPEQLFQL